MSDSFINFFKVIAICYLKVMVKSKESRKSGRDNKQCILGDLVSLHLASKSTFSYLEVWRSYFAQVGLRDFGCWQIESIFRLSGSTQTGRVPYLPVQGRTYLLEALILMFSRRLDSLKLAAFFCSLGSDVQIFVYVFELRFQALLCKTYSLCTSML